jgi:ribosome-binding factor A
LKQRGARVNELVHTELARILARELKDPRVRLVSISGVAVSSDLAHAEVRVSVLGSESERADALAGLDHAKGFLRSQLARAVRLRTVPELSFKLDRGAEHSQRISDLLESLHDDTESP